MRKVNNFKHYLLKKNHAVITAMMLCGFLQACSLTKPGDKDRSTLFNSSTFESLSLAKKKPGSKGQTTAQNTETEEQRSKKQAALAAASYSSGESVALGNFISKVHSECGEGTHNIAYLNDTLALNLDAVRTVLKEVQKGKDAYPLELIAGILFANHEEVLKNKGQRIAQWVNYCQKDPSNPRIYGWITDNTLNAKDTAHLINSPLNEPVRYSLAWAQQYFFSTLFSVPSAIAADNLDLINLNVPVYELSADSRLNDSEVTISYKSIAAGSGVPECLRNIRYSGDTSMVSNAINEGSPPEDRISFPNDQPVIAPNQAVSMHANTTLSFPQDPQSGTSRRAVQVEVLTDDKKEKDPSNFITWIGDIIKRTEGIGPDANGVVISTGTASKPSPSELERMAATTEQPETATKPDSSAPDTNAANQTAANSKTDPRNKAAQKKPYYTPPPIQPSYAYGHGGYGYSRKPAPTPPTRKVPPVQLQQQRVRAAVQANLDPFAGTGIDCPDDYNLISLELGCTNCLGADLKEFGWEGKTIAELEKDPNYQLVDQIFGPGEAERLLNARDGGKHTLNVCFNDTSYIGTFTDSNFQEKNPKAYSFFEDSHVQAHTINIIDGTPHLVITTQRTANYLAYPDVVNSLRTVNKLKMDALKQHTFFYQPDPNDPTTYIISLDPQYTHRVPENKKAFIEVIKPLQFVIPLNDLANRYEIPNKLATVRIGAKNIPKYADVTGSPLLKMFKGRLQYLIAGEMSVKPTYVRHIPEIYAALGAQIDEEEIVDDNIVVGQQDSSFEQEDLEDFKRLFQDEAPKEIAQQDPDNFDQPDHVNFNPRGSLLTYAEMVQECKNFSYHLAIPITGRYTTVHPFNKVTGNLDALNSTLKKEHSSSNLSNISSIFSFIKDIARNTKQTHWDLYLCSNTLETGLLGHHDYAAFLDTMPNTTDPSLQGVFKISNQHSSIIFQKNSSNNAILAGLDIASFDIHDADRVGHYLDFHGPKRPIILNKIREKPPTRMNFQFTGQVKLKQRDIVASAQALNTLSDFHTTGKIRRTPFTLHAIDDVFTVHTQVRGTDPSLTLSDSVTLHKNSQRYQGGEHFSGIADTSKTFDGFMQTFGELGAIQFGLWFDTDA